MSLNVFGGSGANAARFLLPLFFLFSEHSSKENETPCQPAGSNLHQKPATATEMLLLLALKESAERHVKKNSDSLSH